jgi:hypothetical protein
MTHVLRSDVLLGAIAQFDKATLVATLKAARDRKQRVRVSAAVGDRTPRRPRGSRPGAAVTS